MAAALALTAVMIAFAAGALAADVFQFDVRTIELFEGETASIDLIREGKPAEGGTITYTSGNERIASVTADGTITAGSPGVSFVKAVLKDGKRKWGATVTVKVLRAVTNVTLNTTKLDVRSPADESISRMLRGETEHDVIVIPAGKSFDLRATCTPSNASSKKVTYTSTDEGVLRTGDGSARAIQAGECDLIVASAQNPEVKEQYHVLVTQPVKKIDISSETGKTVRVGGTIHLEADVSPATASIQAVTWSSRNEQTAKVDQDGNVTGLKRGSAVIEAKAADGSGKSARYSVEVVQPATGVIITEPLLRLAAGQSSTLHASVLPENANERGIVWSSTDDQIATVTRGGQVKGIRRGECAIIATSKSDPSVSAEITVEVIQRVTSITFPDGPATFPVNTTHQLTWQVGPEDASIKDVTFSTSNRKVATVDANGLVTGHMRGSANITATATDGSGRRGTVRVTVTQPVEGVKIQYDLYHVQLDRYLNIKAIVSPSNANNQNVHFTIDDGTIASVTDHRNIGKVRGWREGTTRITGVTEDGGYSASAVIRVADYARAIVVDDLFLERNNIRLVLRNRSSFTVDRVYFTVETFDANGDPLVCNSDGESNSFQGSYRMDLAPDERSEHYMFDFGDYVQPTERIATVTVTVTGWRDLEGYTRNIAEEDRPSQSYHRFIPPAQTGGNG